jgi:hypothetical protein
MQLPRQRPNRRAAGTDPAGKAAALARGVRRGAAFLLAALAMDISCSSAVAKACSIPGGNAEHGTLNRPALVQYAHSVQGSPG